MFKDIKNDIGDVSTLTLKETFILISAGTIVSSNLVFIIFYILKNGVIG